MSQRRLYLLGGSAASLECAVAAAKAHLPVACLVDGDPTGAASAIAGIAEIVIFTGEEEPSAVRADALTERLPDAEARGARLVDILVRSVRERRSP